MNVQLLKDLPPKHPNGRALKKGQIIDVLTDLGTELIATGFASQYRQPSNAKRIPPHVARAMELEARMAREKAVSEESKNKQK